MFLFFVVMLSGNLYGLEIWRGIFGGLNFGPGIFCFCFVLKPLGFFLVLIFAQFDHLST